MSSENLHVETVQQWPRAYSCDLVTLNGEHNLFWSAASWKLV